MHLENFVEIISGKLLNKPSISFLGDITTKISNLKNGDIFVARDKNDIKKALQNGAYAIISDTFVEIDDNEVGWILVENIDNAIFKFFKYIKVVNNLEIYSCDNITFKLSSHIIKNKQVKFASNVDELLESMYYKIIIINFEVLFFEVETIKNTKKIYFKILRQTLFESKIEYENQIYDIIIPLIFTKHINKIVYFCKIKHLDFSFSEAMFLPIFINSFGKRVRYGQSMRFVYATKDKALLNKYIDFVLGASWGRALLLTNKDIDKNITTKKYNNNRELTDYFLLDKFHFFIVYGVEQDTLSNMLKDDFIEQSLF
ncbi:hypothetical protein [Helicobacter sp. MIT 14-3879]|uniref:hypothetical protein n=1 Tax=Helicobacter sp. MIT 14-3879 TaxID=2040649 RepID=UPI000E1E9A3D|nr:hypothetical protein [Helicobacter sp. MIT 14-3879]RDU61647.1 hypothetical protein CQA44_08380 [Helicobacter sp. MIT 14-3879]